jgi:hypothetical protein
MAKARCGRKRHGSYHAVEKKSCHSTIDPVAAEEISPAVSH